MQRTALHKLGWARSLPPHGAPLLCLCAFVGSSAQAQVATGRSIAIEPSITVQQTLTNNSDLSSGKPRADSITEISPGIRLSSRSGHVQGSLDYSLTGLVYARDSSRNAVQNALDANVRAEVVDNHAFIETRAGISQQSISAFGTQSSNSALVNSNSTEVSTLSVSPSVRGKLGGTVDVQAAVTWAGSRSAASSQGDTRSTNAVVSLGARQGYFGWGINGTHQTNDFSTGRQTTDNQAVGTLTVYPDYDLQLSLRGGSEATNAQSVTREVYGTWGFGVDWQPTERTTFSLQKDHRYFGDSHSLSFQHRMARSIWRYTDTRGTSGDPLSQAANRPVSLYELLYAQFASLEPDPARREQLVRSFIQTNGLDPNAAVSGGFLASGLTLQRAQTVSVALTGLRTTITVSGFRTATQRLDTVTNVSDDLSQAQQVRQLGYTLAASHKLTPQSALTLTASQQKTLDAGSQRGNSLRSLSLSLSGNLGLRTSGALTLRRSLFDSVSDPYNESAMLGSISLRF